MQSRIDPAVIPASEFNNLAVSIIECIKGLCDDPEFITEFELWRTKKENQ